MLVKVKHKTFEDSIGSTASAFATIVSTRRNYSEVFGVESVFGFAQTWNSNRLNRGVDVQH